MKLYLLRHGKAVDHAPEGEDALRPLTPEGRKKTEKIAEGLLRLGISFDHLLTSPYLRAKATADIVAGVFDTGRALAVLQELSPGGSNQDVIRRLRADYASAESLMLVGHEPNLSSLACFLMTGQSGSILELKKAGCCLLDCHGLRNGKCAVLQFLLAPRQLVALAG